MVYEGGALRVYTVAATPMAPPKLCPEVMFFCIFHVFFDKGSLKDLFDKLFEEHDRYSQSSVAPMLRTDERPKQHSEAIW